MVSAKRAENITCLLMKRQTENAEGAHIRKLALTYRRLDARE